MVETDISIVSSKALMELFGTCDQHLRILRDTLEVQISAHAGRIHVSGSDASVSEATAVLEKLQLHLQRFGKLTAEDVERSLKEVSNGQSGSLDAAITVGDGREIRAKTGGQARYVEAVRKHDLVLCAGPAGTGKTYLAVALAVAALRRESVRKIVLVRPAVEAGESLGYLPGDMHAKINPYLRPLLDALREMMDYDLIKRYQEEDVIEVIPLAYMRGRTLNDAFMILDEAQNTTVTQMKMFLTRMGDNSKIIVSGDTSQTDLPPGTRSGLVDGIMRLKNIKGIAAVKLSRSDIVRHPLVQQIVKAYDTRPKKLEP